MSNGNEGIQPLLRQVRIKIADVRGDQNSKLDDLLKWIDDYERREVKEIKVDTTAPPQPKPVTDGKADDSVIESELITKGGSERV